jgi:hypothetical protein
MLIIKEIDISKDFEDENDSNSYLKCYRGLKRENVYDKGVHVYPKRKFMKQ